MHKDKELIHEIELLMHKQLAISPETPDTDLFEAGLLDSLTLVELIFGLEQRFGLQIDIADIDLDNFRSIERIARMVAAGRDAVMAGSVYENTGN